MLKKRRIKNWKRNYNRFLKSSQRLGKERSKDSSNILSHSTNIKHLTKIRNVFSKSDYNSKSNNRFRIPRVFSLVENPGESYDLLKNLLFSLHNQDTLRIDIDYKDCERIDLDASICMDVILRDMILYYKKCAVIGKKSYINSIRPINCSEKIKQFLYATGGYKNLTNISVNYPNIITYPLCIGFRTHKANDEAREAQKEIDVTKLVDYVISCLKKMNKPELPTTARKHLADITGEIIANAEDHSSTNYRYSIGYFEQSNDDTGNYGILNLVIFNFGQSIYERLNDPIACKNKDILNQMRRLSEKYDKKSLFKLSHFNEETLWTLYSLQDKVSSISPHRGHGTINFIEAFFKLKGEGKDDISKLTILSGNTKITFDGTYGITKRVKDGDQYKVLTFNNEGDLEFKPDEKYVKFVPNYFPGTLISVKICIR